MNIYGKVLLIGTLFSLVLSSPSWATDYYVSTTGSKNSGSSTPGDWSNSNCYGNINAAIGSMSSGDTVTINDGTYYIEDGNFVNSVDYNDVPNGISNSNFTTIKARNTLKVRIENSGGLTYYTQIVRLATTDQYVHIDGILGIISNSNYPPYMFSLSGSHNKITNCIGIRKGVADNYTTVFGIGGEYNLVEDCAAAGHGRYLFNTGGATSTAKYNIFRRCVARFDYSDSNQPMASFAHYGNNSGTNTNNVLFQNCIAVDGHISNTGNGTYSYVWGGWYLPKNAYQDKIQGCISLNNEVYYAGITPIEASGGQLTIENTVSWDNTAAGINFRGSGTGIVLNHLTVGANARAFYDGHTGGETMKNSTFWLNTSWGNLDGFSSTHNAFNPISQATGVSTVTANTMTYITRVEVGSNQEDAGDDGSDIGASILYRYGGTGKFYGDPGYDSVSTEELWPWNNDDAIRDAFAETNNPNSGATPATNDTTRGFTGSAYDSTDYPLTKYIWEYLGNSIGDPETFDYLAGSVPETPEVLPASNLQIQY